MAAFNAKGLPGTMPAVPNMVRPQARPTSPNPAASPQPPQPRLATAEGVAAHPEAPVVSAPPPPQYPMLPPRGVAGGVLPSAAPGAAPFAIKSASREARFAYAGPLLGYKSAGMITPNPALLPQPGGGPTAPVPGQPAPPPPVSQDGTYGAPQPPPSPPTAPPTAPMMDPPPAPLPANPVANPPRPRSPDEVLHELAMLRMFEDKNNAYTDDPAQDMTHDLQAVGGKTAGDALGRYALLRGPREKHAASPMDFAAKALPYAGKAFGKYVAPAASKAWNVAKGHVVPTAVGGTVGAMGGDDVFHGYGTVGVPGTRLKVSLPGMAAGAVGANPVTRAAMAGPGVARGAVRSGVGAVMGGMAGSSGGQAIEQSADALAGHDASNRFNWDLGRYGSYAGMAAGAAGGAAPGAAGRVAQTGANAVGEFAAGTGRGSVNALAYPFRRAYRTIAGTPIGNATAPAANFVSGTIAKIAPNTAAAQAGAITGGAGTLATLAHFGLGEGTHAFEKYMANRVINPAVQNLDAHVGKYQENFGNLIDDKADLLEARARGLADEQSQVLEGRARDFMGAQAKRLPGLVGDYMKQNVLPRLAPARLGTSIMNAAGRVPGALSDAAHAYAPALAALAQGYKAPAAPPAAAPQTQPAPQTQAPAPVAARPTPQPDMASLSPLHHQLLLDRTSGGRGYESPFQARSEWPAGGRA